MLPSCLPAFRAVPRPAAPPLVPSCPLARSPRRCGAGDEARTPAAPQRPAQELRARSAQSGPEPPAQAGARSKQAALAPGTAQPWSPELRARGDRFTSMAKNTRRKESCTSGRFAFLFSLCSLLPSCCFHTAPHPRAASRASRARGAELAAARPALPPEAAAPGRGWGAPLCAWAAGRAARFRGPASGYGAPCWPRVRCSPVPLALVVSPLSDRLIKK